MVLTLGLEKRQEEKQWQDFVENAADPFRMGRSVIVRGLSQRGSLAVRLRDPMGIRGRREAMASSRAGIRRPRMAITDSRAAIPAVRRIRAARP